MSALPTDHPRCRWLLLVDADRPHTRCSRLGVPSSAFPPVVGACIPSSGLPWVPPGVPSSRFHGFWRQLRIQACKVRAGGVAGGKSWAARDVGAARGRPDGASCGPRLAPSAGATRAFKRRPRLSSGEPERRSSVGRGMGLGKTQSDILPQLRQPCLS